MILMYHHVGPLEAIPVPSQQVPLEGWGFHLTPEALEFQMLALGERGWRFVSMDQYLAGLNGGETGQKLAVITFDDGWVDNYQWALPVLQRLKLPATFFIVSGAMNGVPPERRMDRGMLLELLAAGMTIGTHSRTHPNLAGIDEADAWEELRGSREDLEDLLGVKVDVLAYPGGRFNDRVVRQVQAAGYRAACSSIAGGRNGEHSRFWLYREIFSDRLDTLRDRVLLHTAGRTLQGWRSRRAVRRYLAEAPGSPALMNTKIS